MNKRIIAILLIFFTNSFLNSQEAFFYESNQIPGYLNPALTGINGSLSFKMLAKEQYFHDIHDFASYGISAEQSFPCKKIDLGLYHVYDKEGAGLFTTNHSALNVVYTIPFTIKKALNNIRIGTKVQYTRNSIEWDRLTFSDQIHPKYNLKNASGDLNPTAFVAPDWNSSSRLALGLGFIHKVDIGLVSKWSLTYGFSMENYTGLFEKQGYDSVLKLAYDKDRLIHKWSFYVAPELPLTKSYKHYFGLRPSIVVRQERTLTNIQVGCEANYRREYALGVYLGTGHLAEFDKDAKALIFNSSIRVMSKETSQVNLGIQYVHNIGGYSSVFGQSMQISLSYLFKKDGCASTPTTSKDCPQTSKRHQLLYENIWYKPYKGLIDLK